MSYLDHLMELRRRVMRVLLFFLAALVLGFFVAQPVVVMLKTHDVAKEIPWFVFNLTDALRVYMQFAFLIAVLLTLPVALYQLWRFVAPGLYPEERRAALLYIPLAVGLFVLGAAFAYFALFPLIVRFLKSVAENMGATPAYGMAQYFGFLFNVVIPVAVLFELPVLSMFLTRLRILNPLVLRKFRRLAYLVLVVVAVVITPPDIVSAVLVYAPLVLLYEIAVWSSTVVWHKQQREDAEREARWQEEERAAKEARRDGAPPGQNGAPVYQSEESLPPEG